MLVRQRGKLVIVLALLMWLIFAYSQVTLMVIATAFVASGITLHFARMTRHYLASHSVKS
jgi:hypothetical protein